MQGEAIIPNSDLPFYWVDMEAQEGWGIIQRCALTASVVFAGFALYELFGGEEMALGAEGNIWVSLLTGGLGLGLGYDPGLIGPIDIAPINGGDGADAPPPPGAGSTQTSWFAPFVNRTGGIHRAGNHCYANSFLQLATAMPEVMEEVRAVARQESSERQKLAQSLAHVSDLLMGAREEQAAIDAQFVHELLKHASIIQAPKNKANRWDNLARQHDMRDFLEFIFDRLEIAPRRKVSGLLAVSLPDIQASVANVERFCKALESQKFDQVASVIHSITRENEFPAALRSFLLGTLRFSVEFVEKLLADLPRDRSPQEILAAVKPEQIRCDHEVLALWFNRLAQAQRSAREGDREPLDELAAELCRETDQDDVHEAMKAFVRRHNYNHPLLIQHEGFPWGWELAVERGDHPASIMEMARRGNFLADLSLLDETPDDLLFFLNRNLDGRRSREPVRVEEEFEVNGSQYQLDQVVVQNGDVGAGHYYIYVRRDEGFVCINDANVTSYTYGQVQQRIKSDAYMVRYTKKEAE